MTWAEALLVVTVAFVAGAAADAVIESFRRARAVIDAPLGPWVVDPASPTPPIGRSLVGDDADRDAVLDQVFPPTRAEGKDVP